MLQNRSIRQLEGFFHRRSPNFDEYKMSIGLYNGKKPAVKL